MKTYKHTKISYDPNFFTAESIEFLFFETKTALEIEQPVVDSPVVPNPKAVFDDMWATGETDEDSSKHYQEHAHEKDEILREFLERMGDSQEQDFIDVGKKLAVQANYSIESDEFGNRVHKLAGEVVLFIPKDVLGEVNDAKATFILRACKVGLDVVMLLAAAIGIDATILNKSVKKTLSMMATTMGPQVVGSVSEFEKLEKLTKTVDKVIQVIRIVHGHLSGWDIAKSLLSEMSAWDWFKAVGEIVFNVGLIAFSGGESVIARMINMGAMVALFVQDIVDMLKALHDWKS